jgi:hypothetical protein
MCVSDNQLLPLLMRMCLIASKDKPSTAEIHASAAQMAPGLQVHAGHIKALEILVWVLDDMQAAEAYCFRLCRHTADAGQGIDSAMLLALVRVLLTPPRAPAPAAPAYSHAHAQTRKQAQPDVLMYDVKLPHVLSLLER